MRRQHARAATTLLLARAILGATAVAADAGGERAVLEEVVVTATRREESLQDVAMSVSAFSGEFLRSTGVTQLASLDQYTPNLKITQGGDSNSTSIRIRGIGSVGTNSGIDPSVGVFIDGVYQGRAGMSIADLVDVERIEVLRGPQGTLYGKNTAAGAITVNTRKPDAWAFESMLEMSYDDSERGEIRGSVNVPLGGTGHAVRLAGFVVSGDHLYENTTNGEGLNDANKWGGRSRLLVDLSREGDGRDYGELLITADYMKEDTDCCALGVISYDGLSTLNIPITDTPSAAWQQMLGRNAAGQYILQYTTFTQTEGFAPPAADPFGDDYWLDGDVGNRVEVGGLALEWNLDLAKGHTLTLVDAWRHYESDSVYDGDFSAYDAVLGSTAIELDQYSSEIRIASPAGEAFTWQGGVYLYYSEFESVGTFSMREALTRNLGLGFFFPDGSLNVDTNTYETTSYAAFGQLTWEPGEDFSATLGLRSTLEEKSREGSQITTPKFFLDVPPVAGPDIFYDESRSDADLSPSLNLRWFASPNLMVYGLVSRGFKSGGYNQRREITGSNGEFDEEIATNWELGWKGTFLDSRLRVNGTLFYVLYDDFQSQTFDGSSLRVTNAGSMESQGVELELNFLVSDRIQGGTSLGYDKAEYRDFDNGQCTVEYAFYDYYILDGAQGGAPGTSKACVRDMAGERLDNAPEWTVSSFMQYEHDFDGGLRATARLEHSFIDGYHLDQDLDPHLYNDDVNLVNLRLALGAAEGGWEVTAWGRNLLDEEYHVFGIDIPTVGGYAGIVAPGEIWGVTVRFTR
jgi:iron complex outermembrane receptor protein